MRISFSIQNARVLIGWAAITTVLFFGSAAGARGQADIVDKDSMSAVETGRTVILGTWIWDIERNRQRSSPMADVWWQQARGEKQFLVPECKAGLAVMQDVDYESVDLEKLYNTKFSTDRVASTLLTPGAVLAMRTTEGNYAKIKIVGYRDLHDFSYADAVFAPDDWKAYVRSTPNRPNYHLEIEWTLYRRPDAL